MCRAPPVISQETNMGDGFCMAASSCLERYTFLRQATKKSRQPLLYVFVATGQTEE